MSAIKNRTVAIWAVLALCVTAFAGMCIATDESDASTSTYSAISNGKVDIYPSPGDVIIFTDVSAINCPYATLNTSTHIATIAVPQMSEGKYSTYDSYVINDTNGGRCWLDLHTNVNWPAGKITDYFYDRSDPIYVTNGTVISFTATYDDTDDMTYYLDYEKVTYVTPGVGLNLDSAGNLSGTVSAPGGTTFYITWATHYDFNDSGVTDEGDTLTMIVVSPEHTHTVAYNGNGNTGGSMANTVVTDTNNGYSNVTLASNGFARSGYTFTGWQVNNVTYQPGQAVSVGSDASVTAIAQWSQNTITASANNISGVSGQAYSNQIGASANNGGSLSYAIKSCTGGNASVNSSGMVTYTAPTVSSTTSYTVTVTVTGTFAQGGNLTQDVSFTVTVDPVLSFTNAATSGTLSVKGA